MVDAIVGIRGDGVVRAVFSIDSEKDEIQAGKLAASWRKMKRTVKRCSWEHAKLLLDKEWAEENSEITPVLNSDGTVQQFMPRVDGKPFRCDCACNVFHKPDKNNPSIYQCNACNQRFISE